MDDPAIDALPPDGRPWYSPLELLKRLIIYAILVYLVMCGYLYFMQTSLLYPSAEISPGAASDLAAQDGLVPWSKTAGSLAPQGYVHTDFTQPSPRGTIVVFHGNGGTAYDRAEYVTAFAHRGFRTFLYEYPGYGGRPGTPSEAAIVPDARAVIRDLDKSGFGPIYVWGESLGAGVAASVCADPTLPVHGLGLMTPWDTLANAAKFHYPWFPVKLLLTDHYDSVANLQGFTHPVCVIRSSDDDVIPPAMAINLYNQLPGPKHDILQNGYGHSDWPNTPEYPWWDEALNFIAPQK